MQRENIGLTMVLRRFNEKALVLHTFCLESNEKTMVLQLCYSGFALGATRKHWCCNGFVYGPANKRWFYIGVA